MYAFNCIVYVKIEYYLSILIHRLKLITLYGLYAWSSICIPCFLQKPAQKTIEQISSCCLKLFKQNFPWDLCWRKSENQSKIRVTTLKKYSVRGFVYSSLTSKIFKYCVLNMVPDFTPSPLLWNKILKWRSYSDLLFLEDFVSNKITIVLLPTEEGCG